MASVLFEIEGSSRDALILGFAFEHDKLSDKLIGCSIDKANKILIEYGAIITKCERHNPGHEREGKYSEVVHIRALTEDEVFKAKRDAEDYRAWLIGTSGPNDFPRPSPATVEKIRKEHPCPVKLTPLARAAEQVDLSTFKSRLYDLFRTDEYKLRLWDWKHSARYAGLFAEEETPDLNQLPQEAVRRHFSLP